MLNYPTGEDPNILEQLATFSIASDLHLYETEPKYFISRDDCQELLQKNSIN